MKPADKVDFETLVNHTAPYSISLFLPTHPAGPQTRQDPIRFKNLVREIEHLLEEAGLRVQEIPDKLAPLHRILSDREFWQHQDLGLAVFLDDGALHSYRVPVAFKELCVIGERFHLKPLLAMLSNAMCFYLLALSQDTVQLYAGSRFEMEPLDLEGVPRSFGEATQFDEMERQVQMHTGAMSNPQGRQPSGIFHGHGAATDGALEKKRLLEFCHVVAHGVHRELNARGSSPNLPLVLAATEPLAGIYRMANTSPNLYHSVIHGNPHRVSPEEFHRQALEILAPQFEEERRQALERYQQLTASARAGTRLETILAAACYGQVDTLFVSTDDHTWGCFDPDTGEAEIHETRAAGDQDLLDWAAVRVYLAGGTVYALDRAEMPDDAAIAATFRFAPVAVGAI